MASYASEPLGSHPVRGAGRSSSGCLRKRRGGLLMQSSCRRGNMGTMMDRLSSLELRIVRSMLAEEFGTTSPLLDGISSLKFETRHMTGTGYYVNFSNPQDLSPINKLNTELSGDLQTTLPAPHDVVG